MSSLSISFRYIEGIFVVRAVTYSSCALLVWDYFLTLDDEVVYIWASPRSIVKYLFIGNRYISLLVQPLTLSQVAGAFLLQSTASCLGFSWALALSRMWSYDSVHLLVLLRIWILYGRTLAITIALLVGFVLYAGAKFALLAYILSAIHYGATASGQACWQGMPHFSWLVWVVGCVLEVYLFMLTIFMLWRDFPSRSSRISRLVRSLYVHALIFFLANILDNVSNMVVWTVFTNSLLSDVTSSITIALVNITGQRLAIDLRRLQVQRGISQSEVSREVEIQLAAFDDMVLSSARR